MKTAAIIKIGDLRDKDEEKRGKIGLVDMPEFPLGEEDVKVKVAYCAICGSDPHVAEGCFGPNVPIGLGHEVSGVVVELGKKATKKGLKVGDRVAANFLRFCGTCYYCQNGQQQFCQNSGEYSRPGMAPTVTWHESQFYKLPDSVSLKEGCMLEPTAIAVRMVDKVHPKVGSRIAICGGGPIGLFALQLFHLYGAVKLTVIEPIADRRELAKSFGAEYTIDPMSQNVVEEARKITDGYGFDAVIDASGSAGAAPGLLQIAAKGGMVLYGAMYPTEYRLPLDLFKDLYFNELTLTGIFVAPYAFPRALQLLPKMNLKPFTTAIFPLDQAVEAYKAQITGKHPKILVQCNDEIFE
jgi:(R,R)-butanediol dehydrogenase/meso-butanediol dehydrogenase/diacetyl reductase/L-iditol 2-dehydrogenase